jgi:hypothetical protein
MCVGHAHEAAWTQAGRRSNLVMLAKSAHPALVPNQVVRICWCVGVPGLADRLPGQYIVIPAVFFTLGIPIMPSVLSMRAGI